ncbi:AraC family transcriptional regulator [Polaribacter batillariae]|uniref:AraC family transcriptional regulator n=1 Tax=Polaribacter batillariae TaxID=2808900 RepID=A0ABX7SVS8_9FLAO|nr:DUF6597 domain-containing transcriptional factor [Polaribacter batillariae]QTD37759.1 AraC family transcriptional regulator [Polaribacter batillariae]
MKLKYYITGNASHLVEEFYNISYSEKIVPLKSIIIPMGFSSLAFPYSSNQYFYQNKKRRDFKKLTLVGQFYKSYEMCIDSPGFCCGISFKPTTLYKLINLDISQFTNNYVDFYSVKPILSKKLEGLFIKYKNNSEQLFKELANFLNLLPLTENKDTIIIDGVIEEIHKKEGLLSVLEIMETVPFCQKTLETQFKKMVGLTPGKYIRLRRFLSLMKKYEKEQINLKDLIYMYNYYDESHFSKDFKLFTNKIFKKYFKKDYLIVKEALKK